MKTKSRRPSFLNWFVEGNCIMSPKQCESAEGLSPAIISVIIKREMYCAYIILWTYRFWFRASELLMRSQGSGREVWCCPSIDLTWSSQVWWTEWGSGIGETWFKSWFFCLLWLCASYLALVSLNFFNLKMRAIIYILLPENQGNWLLVNGPISVHTTVWLQSS